MTENLTALAVNSYFDSVIWHKERQRLRDTYVGHDKILSKIGEYQSMQHEKDARVLIQQANGMHLLDNICRHRQAVMLQGRGRLNGEHIVCPVHRWTYDASGELIGAPHFAQKPCERLKNYPLMSWQGMYFEALAGVEKMIQQLSALPVAPYLNFENYQHHKSIIHECHYNWKTFIEVYLDDYHVVPFHPGLGNFVNCQDLNWYFGDHFSLQTVGVHQGLTQAGSPIYNTWQNHVKQFYGENLPLFGAIWLTIYPGIMVEWYPCTLVVSRLVPNGPQSTINYVDFFYLEEIVAFEEELMQAQQAAYMETCVEDDEIAMRIDAGRRIYYEHGEEPKTYVQHPLEDGIDHFYDWYQRHMGI